MTRLIILSLGILALAACDRITGEYDQRIFDAEAVGYACRVSLKKPEDCMKENETQSPSSILQGWKDADKAIKEGNIDPSMKPPAPKPVALPAASGTAAPPEAPKHEPAKEKSGH